MKQKIKQKINKLRKEMVLTSTQNNNNLLNPQVQKASQKLDKQIVEYMSLQKKEAI